MHFYVYLINGNREQCIFSSLSPDIDFGLIDPNLHLAANSAGSFEAGLNGKSPLLKNDLCEKMVTKIRIEEHRFGEGFDNDKVIFYGRLLSVSEDFFSRMSIHAEGAYSFFNDSIQTPRSFHVTNKGITGTNIGRNPTSAIIYVNGETPLVTVNADTNDVATFNSVSYRYDGHSWNKIRDLGTTTTEISDGTYDNPISIDGELVTVYENDSATYNGTSLIFDGTAWRAKDDKGATLTDITEQYMGQKFYEENVESGVFTLHSPYVMQRTLFINTGSLEIFDKYGNGTLVKIVDNVESTAGSVDYVTGQVTITNEEDLVYPFVVTYYYNTSFSTIYTGGTQITAGVDEAAIFNDTEYVFNGERWYNYGVEVTDVLKASTGRHKIALEVLVDVIRMHNQICPDLQICENPEYMRVTVPATVFADNPFVITDYASTYKVLEKLRSTYKGNFRVRYVYDSDSVGGVLPVLDWFEDYDTTNLYNDYISKIDFGVNLLSFTRKRDGSELTNAVLMLGKKVNSVNTDAIGHELSIAPTYQYKGEVALRSDLPETAPITDIYKVNEEGYAGYYDYDHTQWARHELSDDPEVTDDDWKNNEVLLYGPVYSAEGVDTGNAWGNGQLIRVLSGEAAMGYDDETTYSAMGYWDSEASITPDKPNTSLEVKENELYYICASGYGDTVPVVLYSVTQGRLGTNPAYVLTSKKASSTTNGDVSKLNYQKVVIPTPNPSWGVQEMYLNVCSRHGLLTDPKMFKQLNMHVYKGRITSRDEHVTLNGLDTGEYEGYLTSEQDAYGNSTTVYKEPEQLPDGWFIYPKQEDTITSNFYDSKDSFPDTGAADNLYCAKDNGGVYHWDGEASEYVMDSNKRGYEKSGLYILDRWSIAKYGRIEKVLEYADCTSPESLRELGSSYMFIGNFEAAELNVSAFDLAMLDNSIESPDILDPIEVYSAPHMINVRLPLNERDIPLNRPSGMTYNIGYKYETTISKMTSSDVN